MRAFYTTCNVTCIAVVDKRFIGTFMVDLVILVDTDNFCTFPFSPWNVRCWVSCCSTCEFYALACQVVTGAQVTGKLWQLWNWNIKSDPDKILNHQYASSQRKLLFFRLQALSFWEQMTLFILSRYLNTMIDYNVSTMSPLIHARFNTNVGKVKLINLEKAGRKVKTWKKYLLVGNGFPNKSKINMNTLKPVLISFFVPPTHKT